MKIEFSDKFVCEDIRYSTYSENVPAPLFRKSFVVDGGVDEAEILICGLGFYELFVNGEKITKGYIAPYISNSDHICYYDKYDIAKYLTAGENVIGVMLGDGHQNGKTTTWNFRKNKTNSAPLLALTATIVCGGKTISFEADDFVCKKGPILFNDLRSGVFYDARLEEDGWNAPGFEEKDWHKPICGVYKPRGKAKICEAEPIKAYREIKPVSIRKGELDEYHQGAIDGYANAGIIPFEEPAERTGGYIYDFGENNAGIVRLKIKGERGQKVSLQCGEQLVDGKMSYVNIYFYPDGFSQRDIYYLKGDGEEIFEPMFTFHGFRYVYVSGITEEQATEDLLTYIVMSSDLKERGTFECSDNVANKIYEMGRRSDRSNFFYFPMDCPHREKNGWTADAALSAEHMIMTISPENSWRVWLDNIRLSMREDGMLPGIIPTDTFGYDWGNGPAWDCVLFVLPYMAYKYRGETDIIKENAGAMLRYLEYISGRRDDRGMVAVGLGDWVPVKRNDGGKDSDAPLEFTDSVMVLDMCRKSAEMFEAVGLNLHKEFAQKLGEEMLTAIRRELVDIDTCAVTARCQTTQAMAIFYDVFRDDEKSKAFDVLMDIVHEDNDNITSGVLGLRVIYHVLAQFGETELAYNMITKPEYPSYGYWVNKGETTFLEHFIEYDNMFIESKNHHFMGDVVQWFMRYPGGLNVESNNKVLIKPYFIEKLNNCRTTYELSDGAVEISWERNGDGIDLNVKVTGEVEYRVEVENGYTLTAVSDGKYRVVRD